MFLSTRLVGKHADRCPSAKHTPASVRVHRQVSGRAQALVSFLSTLRHPLRILDSVGAGDPACSWNAGVATQIDRPSVFLVDVAASVEDT